MNKMSLPTIPSSVNLVDHLNTKLQSALEHIAQVRYKKILQKQKQPQRKQNNINKLKKDCRKAEQRWRQTKLQVHYDILKELLTEYNAATRNTRLFISLVFINKNLNNPRALFSTFDSLIKPATNYYTNHLGITICNEFSAYFRDQIAAIRNIFQTGQCFAKNCF